MDSATARAVLATRKKAWMVRRFASIPWIFFLFLIPVQGCRHPLREMIWKNNTCIISRTLIVKLVEDPSRLGENVRFVPEIHRGHPVGLRVFVLGSTPLLERIGIKGGDRIVSINGDPVHSFENLRKWLVRLRDATNLRVAINRAGETTLIDYVIKGAPTSIDLKIEE